MTRGAVAGPSGPPLARVYKVDPANRLRLPGEELTRLVPWLKGETVERVALPGPRGGVLVTALEAVDDAIAQLGPDDLREEDAGTKRADYARFLGMRWPLTFTFEPRGKRYSVTLPEGARQFDLLPGPEGRVVVFIAGEIFEIWDREEWLRHLRSSQVFTVGSILKDLE